MRSVLFLLIALMFAPLDSRADELEIAIMNAELAMLEENESSLRVHLERASHLVQSRRLEAEPTGFHVARLRALSSSPPDAAKLAKLAERAEKVLGTDHPETLRVRLARARARVESGGADKKEAISELKRIGEVLAARDGSNPSRELAECFDAYGRATFSMLPAAKVEFEGDHAKALRPQCRIIEPITSDTITAAGFVRHAVTLEERASGSDSKRTALRKSRLAILENNAREESERLIQEALYLLRERLREEINAERWGKVERWKSENPEPYVWICTGEYAYAYHNDECHILDDCAEISVKLSEAKAKSRRACEICEPIVYWDAPESFYVYQLDGREGDIRRDRASKRKAAQRGR